MSNDLLAVNGVECSSIASGIKKNNSLDLSLISLIKGSKTAAVFTQNIFCAAPILVAKNHLNSNIEALLINSGNANAVTGSKGLKDCDAITKKIAQELGIPQTEVFIASTGIIGVPLPAHKILQAQNNYHNVYDLC